jgi:hypothetical protein
MYSDKAPYIVTVIIAVLAWSLTQVVGRLLATPMLRYSIEENSGAGDKTQYIRLKNITRDKTFRNLRLVVAAPPGGELTQRPHVIPSEPAWEGDQPGSFAPRTFEFTFKEIQPNWTFEVAIRYRGPEQPRVRMSNPDATVFIVQPSIQTWLVEHEFEVFVALVIIWLCILLGLWVAWGLRFRGLASAVTVLVFLFIGLFAVWQVLLQGVQLWSGQFVLTSFAQPSSVAEYPAHGRKSSPLA